MPRLPSDRTFQVTFKIPEAWVEKADALAAARSAPGLQITRTDILRQAVYAGLEAMGAAKRGAKP